MAIRQVPGTYSTIRSAISDSQTGDTIAISSGSYSITNGGPATFSYAAPTNLFSISGFTTVANLIYDGVGNAGDSIVTTITGNPRLYVSATDGKPPTQIRFTDLDFLYSGGSGYVLQTGQFGTLTGAPTQSIFLDNLSFRGTHGGAVGTGNANPKGNYGAVLGFQNLTLTNTTVSLTGQSTFNANLAASGGSSFLMVQGGIGGTINIANNTFDESGYRNALSIFESQNVTLSGNTFSRSDAATRFVREGGNKISNSTNVNVSGNTFQDGSYLTLAGGQGTLSSNTFNGTNINGSSASPIAIRLETSGVTLPSYTYNSNVFYLTTPFVNTTTTAVNYTNNSLQNTFLNPYVSGNTPAAFRSYITGTNNVAGDVLTGTANARDFIAGQLGNDTLDGGAATTPSSDIDFYLFNTTPNLTTNLDTILNYTSSGGTTDQLVLDRRVFTNLTTETLNSSGNVVAGLNGRGRVVTTAVVSKAGGVADAANQRIIVDSTGVGPAGPGGVYYDQDGNGPIAAIPFARVSTNSGTTWINSASQLGNVLVI
ncbi:MAG: hypothetical protein VKP63_06685 [Cyanobacteriota bacterium]|nr:hypothetical protein [Cyanobacteriota bacterium]